MMVRLHVAAAAILILLPACTHETSGSRATTAQPAGQGATSAPTAADPALGAEPHRTQPDAGTSAVGTQPDATQTNTASATAATPTQPVTPTAQPTPTAPAAPGQTGSAAAKPRSSSQAPTPPARPTSPAPAAATAAAAAASAPSPAPVATAPPLDLDGLEQRLRNTRAIGVFTKLSLKNQVDDLLGQFKAFHQGQSRTTLGQLRQKYELLVMKVVSLLQDGDPTLANAILASREAIWGVLTDPQKFAAIGNSMRS
jgi:hypothetical protein